MTERIYGINPFDVSYVTADWLRENESKFVPQSIYKPPTINGSKLMELTPNLDGRGDVIELWSEPWIESQGIVRPKHCYQSATDYCVTKCWHLHAVHIDQFTVTRGKLQVVMVDTREGSPTFGHVNSVFLGTERPRFLMIPPGVMHGWKALTQPEVIVVNFQSEVYDPKDEFKFPWDCVLKDVWEPKNG